MILKKYNEIMEKSEEHRNKWALGLSVALSIFIFVSFAFYKGFINFGSNDAVAGKQSSNQLANVISVKSAPSPLQNSREALVATFSEINKQYQKFKDSMSAVLVPFVTGIEVYERK